ncbi:hypothetical protein Tco_1069942 [Tanacetum coccineum]|uniref:Uncharacterized protein n=1 Tax=Tanacetum coccineum TaxID=301880 RepID=A0ABQ5HKC2_9ASTR
MRSLLHTSNHIMLVTGANIAIDMKLMSSSRVKSHIGLKRIKEVQAFYEGTAKVHKGTDEVLEGTAQEYKSTAHSLFKSHGALDLGSTSLGNMISMKNEGTAQVHEGTAQVHEALDIGSRILVVDATELTETIGHIQDSRDGEYTFKGKLIVDILNHLHALLFDYDKKGKSAWIQGKFFIYISFRGSLCLLVLSLSTRGRLLGIIL